MMTTGVAHGTSRLENLDQPILERNDDVSVMRLGSEPASNWKRWTAIIGDRLIEWGKSGQVYIDDDIKSPSLRAIDVACVVADQARNHNIQYPTRVVADGDGGIAFEFEHATNPYYIEVYEDGSVDLLIFQGTALQAREHVITTEELS